MSFLLSWVLKQASLQTPWANFYVIWSRFVASIPELRRLGLTKTSWLYPFKPAKGLQGFHPDLLQFFWWDKKVPLESMSFLSNWVLKQACLQFPWTIFFNLWDFTKFHLPKKISRFCFANVNALQWLLKVKIQCKFFLWLHLYLCKSSLYVHMLLLHQVGPKVNSIHIYIYSNSPILKEFSSVLEMSFASHCSAPMDFMHCLGIWFQDYCKPFGTVTSNII